GGRTPKETGSAADRFQHTAARRRLGKGVTDTSGHPGFNTQPPEGGWCNTLKFTPAHDSFNTQPHEGGWLA
ncbi:hypothetical protein ACTHSS_11300, partial [Neisseria sp. P0009.S003]